MGAATMMVQERTERSDERRLFPEERRAAVLDLLRRQPKVLVSELAAQFGVSSFTVRADLDELEQEGRLRRCHGGALSLAKTTTVEDYHRRLEMASEAKQAIGVAAARLVEDGDSIVIDTGTTTLELARQLGGHRQLTIVTNDFEVATLAEKLNPSASLLFLGGMVRSGYRYTYGDSVLRELERLHVDKAFLSANGFTPEAGFTSESYEQGLVKSAYARCAAERIVLLDTSKLGVVTFASCLSVADADVIVTDVPLDAKASAAIRRANDNIELISAS